MTPPGEQETMTKATAGPRRAKQLVNQHNANIVFTTSTVASRHDMPGRGSKTTTTTVPGCALTPGQDSVPCKPSLLVSPSLRLTTTRSGEPLSVCNLAPELYIRAARPSNQGTDSQDFIRAFVHLTPPTSFLSLHTPL